MMSLFEVIENTVYSVVILLTVFIIANLLNDRK
jgi:hypothetical protein